MAILRLLPRMLREALAPPGSGRTSRPRRDQRGLSVRRMVGDSRAARRPKWWGHCESLEPRRAGLVLHRVLVHARSRFRLARRSGSPKSVAAPLQGSFRNTGPGERPTWAEATSAIGIAASS